MNPLFTGSKSRGRFFLNVLVKITGNFEQPNEPVGLVSTETCSFGQNEPAYLKIVKNRPLIWDCQMAENSTLDPDPGPRIITPLVRIQLLTDIFDLKHVSRIFGHCNNQALLVSHFKASIWALKRRRWHTHKPDRKAVLGCCNVRKFYWHALEWGYLVIEIRFGRQDRMLDIIRGCLHYDLVIWFFIWATMPALGCSGTGGGGALGRTMDGGGLFWITKTWARKKNY